MSVIPVVPGSVARMRPVRRGLLRPLPDPPLADVRDIGSAPSARRRREALLAEDPSARRRPVLRAVPAPVATPSVGVGRTLTRALAVVAIVLGGAGLGVGAGLLAQPDPYSGPTVVHSVVPGDSVWGLAASVGSQRPLEQVVVDIEALNGIDGGLVPGQTVVLPAR